jgi:hypothetical protein
MLRESAVEWEERREKKWFGGRGREEEKRRREGDREKTERAEPFSTSMTKSI